MSEIFKSFCGKALILELEGEVSVTEIREYAGNVYDMFSREF